MMQDPSSRYHACGLLTYVDADGNAVRYLERRFLPATHQPGDPVRALHQVQQSERDRLDSIAARYLPEPEQYWRIADAHRVLDPDALTRNFNAVLVIPLVSS